MRNSSTIDWLIYDFQVNLNCATFKVRFLWKPRFASLARLRYFISILCDLSKQINEFQQRPMF
ncbi:hypothetical protein DP114_17935 [Brasilonema sennae CENA114]|uniref:Uncharacterized protein n=1 Tax=Brasilonema sennae CENA114 TaxID=415709 RepID=A0A856MIP5_9CYAN|nr:hypothetical protein DP114_17935 [Brasilonema sennae CENA114]